MNVPDPKAKAQLDLLCKLIGSNSKQAKNDFKLTLLKKMRDAGQRPPPDDEF